MFHNIYESYWSLDSKFLLFLQKIRQIIIGCPLTTTLRESQVVVWAGVDHFGLRAGIAERSKIIPWFPISSKKNILVYMNFGVVILVRNRHVFCRSSATTSLCYNHQGLAFLTQSRQFLCQTTTLCHTMLWSTLPQNLQNPGYFTSFLQSLHSLCILTTFPSNPPLSSFWFWLCP